MAVDVIRSGLNERSRRVYLEQCFIATRSFRSLKEEYIPFPRMDMLSRAASCKLSHTRVVRRRVFEGLGGG